MPSISFPCVAIVFPDMTVWIHYGCADTCIGFAIGNLDEIIAFTKANSF